MKKYERKNKNKINEYIEKIVQYNIENIFIVVEKIIKIVIRLRHRLKHYATMLEKIFSCLS